MFLFIVFSLIAIVAGIGVIVSRRPIYSALFLLTHFASLAALYILLQAQFLAAVQVIVYAGAIVVLFLFVVMLLGGGDLTGITNPNRKSIGRFGWSRIAAVLLGVALLIAVVFGVVTGQLSSAQGDATAFGQGSVQAIGAVLYTNYMLPFELASVLLLVGMIGAVVLARPPD